MLAHATLTSIIVNHSLSFTIFENILYLFVLVLKTLLCIHYSMQDIFVGQVAKHVTSNAKVIGYVSL